MTLTKELHKLRTAKGNVAEIYKGLNTIFTVLKTQNHKHVQHLQTDPLTHIFKKLKHNPSSVFVNIDVRIPNVY